MARSTARRRLKATAFPYRALARPLGTRARNSAARYLGALLRFQQSLDRWPKPPAAPDATPFVSLYVRGGLRGCQGSAEGKPGERLARAFLAALNDRRLGPSIAPGDRASVSADVSYPIAPRPCSVGRIAETLELGTHGLAFAAPAERSAILLPQVGRDRLMTSADAFLDALARKAGRSLAFDDEVVIFEAQHLTARLDGGSARKSDGAAAAAEFLAGCIDAEGRICFGYDARAGRRLETGMMLHGRAASVIAALAAFGGRRARIGKAKRWLAEAIDAALSGARVDGFPTDAARRAATLALATLAGLPLTEALVEQAHRARPLAENPWHAAQVVAAAGNRAPARVMARVTLDFENPHGENPWLLAAARALGDARAERRVEKALMQRFRKAPPHRGGFGLERLPEIPVTALATELLAASPRADARRVAERGRDFLRAHQLLANGSLHASLDPATAHGAWPVTPTHHLLRADATAHALSALLAKP